MNVAFCTEGGARIGLGHVRRCLSLAQALRSRGASCAFVVSGDPVTLEMIRKEGCGVREADRCLSEQALAVTEGLHPGAVVVDSYDVKTGDLARVRRFARLVVIDDLADRELPADVIVNCTLNAKGDAYRAPSSTKFLLGPEYALLRPEFADAPRRRINGRIRRALITLGGGDPSGLTAHLIQWVRGVLPGTMLDVVLGPLAGDFFRGSMSKVRVHRDPSSMRDLMESADLAVSAGGQTTYELAATGTPAVIIAVAANQVPQSLAWDAAGVLAYAGRAGDHEMSRLLTQKIRILADDPALRRSMSERGRNIVDGRGAERVAEAVFGR